MTTKAVTEAERLEAEKLVAAQREFDEAKKERDVAHEAYFGPRDRYEAAQTRVMRADAALKTLLRGGRI